MVWRVAQVASEEFTIQRLLEDGCIDQFLVPVEPDHLAAARREFSILIATAATQIKDGLTRL
ncbi:MAG: hypothetical protein WA476_21470 [Acidobacteriaceae bacterium]